MELAQACIIVSLFMLLVSVILFSIMALSWRIERYPGDTFVQVTLFFWLATSFMCGTSGFMWFNIWVSHQGYPMAMLITLPMCMYWGVIHGRWFGRLSA